MSQQQIFMLLRSDRRFWSAREICRVLGVKKRSVLRSLNSLSKVEGMVVQYEDVKFGVRKLYKYEGEE